MMTPWWNWRPGRPDPEPLEVAGAGYENGLLNIDLTREIPEPKKPRKVEIGAREDNERKAA